MSSAEYRRRFVESADRPKDPKRQMTGLNNHQAGAAFEDLITKSCITYKEQGIASIVKTPEAIKVLQNLGNGKFICCFTEKAQEDYKGVLHGGRSIAFEAKHTQNDRILQSAVNNVQWEYLNDSEKMSAICFVLVSIKMYDYFNVPWAIWKNMKEVFGHKYMNETELAPFKCKTKYGSICFLDGINTRL